MSVRVSVEKSDRKCLNLASFSNGTVKRKYAGDLQVDFLSRKNCTNLRLKEHRIMVAETDQMSYVGKNFGEITANKAKGLCKYYVGVLDPESNKMTVYDTEKYLLQPHIPGRDDEVDTGQIQASSISEKNDLLTSAFGSSKKRKAMESRLRHKVEKDVLEGALSIAVDKGLSQVETYKPTEEGLKDWEQSLIPPYDKDAKTPEDVYKLKDIISNNEMDMLTMNAKPFIECNVSTIQEWCKTQQYPTYVLNHLGTMPLTAKPREHKAKCLLYLHYLMHLFRINSRQIRLKEPLPKEWPIPIKRKLLDMFTKMVQAGTRHTRCCPSSLKDKLVSYILTLCLIIDEFTLDLTDLIKDLKLGKVKLEMHAKALGCNIATKKEADGPRTSAVLKVPLKFPDGRNKLQRS